jgi:hypothetical protein
MCKQQKFLYRLRIFYNDYREPEVYGSYLTYEDVIAEIKDFQLQIGTIGERVPLDKFPVEVMEAYAFENFTLTLEWELWDAWDDEMNGEKFRIGDKYYDDAIDDFWASQEEENLKNQQFNFWKQIFTSTEAMLRYYVPHYGQPASSIFGIGAADVKNAWYVGVLDGRQNRSSM